MNITKRKNRFAYILILIAAALVLLTAVTVSYYARAEVVVTVSDELSEEYAFGDIFTAPECSFTKNGATEKGSFSIEYPSGAVTNKSEITLDESGKYRLKYVARIDGRIYTKEYGFTVNGKLANYKNEKTTMEYGLCTDFGANTEGLMVKIANGDALSFNHVFDMTKVTTSTKLLEGFVVPTVQGTPDFTKMVFTFTDVENPDVKLVYHGNFHNDSRAYGITFFTAAGNGQVHCGLEYVGKLHVGTDHGCLVPHSFLAIDTGLYWDAKAPENAPPDSKQFCISYDYASNQAWAGGKIISDLDDSNYYDTLWFGFPSGKAKLTVSALNYNGASANMCFTSILGIDLAAENFVDDQAPVVTVDCEYDEMPHAIVGKEYPVPTASAIDEVSGKCEVTASVWYDYGTEYKKMIDVKNNRFKVDNVGTYAIVYEAVDGNGNVGREVLWVRSYLSQYKTPLKVVLDSSFETEVTVGTVCYLPKATVSGGSGKSTVKYTVTKGTESCEIDGDKFILEKDGVWTLTCTATDFIGVSAVAAIEIEGRISDKPVIVEEPEFPVAFISGCEYVLPYLNAYDYSSGSKTEKVCEVKVTDGKGSVSFTSGDRFTPNAESGGEAVTLTYSCDGEEFFAKQIPVTVVLSKERIPGNTERYRSVVDVEKYFFTGGGIEIVNDVALEGNTGITLTASEKAERLSTRFINPQMANTFSVDLFTVPNKSKFSAVTVRLYDMEDSSISVSAVLEKDDGQTVMRVGETQIILLLDFDGASGSSYSVGFKDGRFLINGTTSLDVLTTDKGKPFEGFPSGKVYFDIEMSDAEVGATVFINKICGVNASNSQDNTGPFIETKEPVITNWFKDTVYTVQGVIACDVLCPNLTTSMTVLKPDGSVATDVNGLTLSNVDADQSYDVMLSDYGDYYVSVVVSEASTWKYANSSYLEYVVTVIDGEAPTITFKKQFRTEVKVGKRLVIPEFTVSDNFTKSENITVLIMITNPKGMPIYLYGDERSVICEYAGVYKVDIYVYDEMGNLTTYTVEVTAR